MKNMNKVVARYKDGLIIKGKTCDFNPNKTIFHVELESGDVVKVDMETLKIVKINTEELKAAFFVKDFKGKAEYAESYSDVIAGAGKKIRIDFADGEVIIGHALNYSPDRDGFFVIPADLQSNNERIFVILSATKKITFLE